MKYPDQRLYPRPAPSLSKTKCSLGSGSAPLYIAEDALPPRSTPASTRNKGLQGTRRKEFLKIRTWPPTDDLASPRWHDFYEPEYPLLVFGHDAPGGLVVKKRAGRPYLIGLDSGCIYGGQLSGYVLEEARLVQVESQQAADVWKRLA